MSSFQVQTMPGRVVLLHDMEDRSVVSELDVEQAGILVELLQDAVRSTLANMQQRAAGNPEPAFL